jgi:hypothetical protein
MSELIGINTFLLLEYHTPEDILRGPAQKERENQPNQNYNQLTETYRINYQSFIADSSSLLIGPINS